MGSILDAFRQGLEDDVKSGVSTDQLINRSIQYISTAYGLGKSDSDWTKLRNKYAGMAMQGLIVADAGYNLSTPRLAKMAVQQADALIDELKKDKKP